MTPRLLRTILLAAVAFAAGVAVGYDSVHPLWLTLAVTVPFVAVVVVAVAWVLAPLHRPRPRYQAVPLAGTTDRWAVLDHAIGDYLDDGPQDNPYTWTGYQPEAEAKADDLNRPPADPAQPQPSFVKEGRPTDV
jgi:hypothetical protein